MSNDDEKRSPGGTDGVDLDALKAMQWRNFESIPQTDVALAPPAPAEEQRDPLNDFAEALLAAYELEAIDAQRDAFIALLDQAEKLGIRLAVFTQHPHAAAFFLDLVNQHVKALSEAQVHKALNLMIFMSIDNGPETTDLIVEAIRNGHQGFLTFLALLTEGNDWAPEPSEAGPKLLDLMLDSSQRALASEDDEQRWELLFAASKAAWWLRFTRWPAAVQPLKQAMRGRSIMLRAMAAETLVVGFADSLTGEELTAWLDDAIVCPPPRSRKGNLSPGEYGEALVDALAGLRPPEAIVPLSRMLRGDTEPIGGWGSELDDAWAAVALAAAFPHLALDAVDSLLADRDSLRRYTGMTAARRLPPEHARPRLQRCLGDGYRLLDAKAREALIKLDGACPTDPTQGLFVELLDAPLSPAALESLQRLRSGGVEEELQRLWSSTPSSEWLVLLLLAMSSHPQRFGTDRDDIPLPSSWPTACLARVRALAPSPERDALEDKLVRGLELFIGRYPNGVDLFTMGIEKALKPGDDGFAPAAKERLLAALVEVASQAWANPEHVLRCIPYQAQLPASSFELLWRLSSGEAIGRWGIDGENAALLARTRLLEQAAFPLRERLRAELPTLLASASAHVVANAVALATEQNDAEIGALLLDFARRCEAPRLAADLLPEAYQTLRCWAWSDVQDEGGLAFALAIRCEGWRQQAARVPNLVRALDDTRCGSVAAVEAAAELLGANALSRDDPRIDAILERADPALLIRLLRALMLFDSEGLLTSRPLKLRDEPQQPLAYARLDCALRKVFSHPDERIVADASDALSLCLPLQAKPLLEELSRSHPSTPARRHLCNLIDLPIESDRYWFDA